MKRAIFAASVVTMGVLFFTATAKAANIKEGEWSMTTVIRMEGMDDQSAQAMQEMENMSPEEKAMMEGMMGGMGMKMGAQGGGMGISTTTTQCLTNDDPVPEASSEKGCTQTHNVKGNTVSFEVVCPTSHSTGQVTYKNDTMKGTIKSTQIENGKETAATIDISGQYVGPCDQSTANPAPIRGLAAAQGLSEKELSLKEKELDLKKQELDLKKKELDLQTAGNTKNSQPAGKPTLETVSSAVNTTNNARNTFNGLRSLLGH